jgi:hypothetical protein
MNKKIKSFIFAIAISLSTILPTLILGNQVNADANSMLWGNMQDNVQDATGLGNADPRVLIGSIIQIFLGFLGIIAVIIILYGGFMWMTAMGDESKVGTAKKAIYAGVIGLIIILMAFGIAQFVINAIYTATNATG